MSEVASQLMSTHAADAVLLRALAAEHTLLQQRPDCAHLAIPLVREAIAITNKVHKVGGVNSAQLAALERLVVKIKEAQQ